MATSLYKLLGFDDTLAKAFDSFAGGSWIVSPPIVSDHVADCVFLGIDSGDAGIGLWVPLSGHFFRRFGRDVCKTSLLALRHAAATLLFRVEN